ncbi:MAG: glucose-6-phosphate dehydrogenase [Gemmatimonadota bacterium]|nr:glucose-6-phosphate dehydrogenase [Gemmatimonadota bacterium]
MGSDGSAGPAGTLVIFGASGDLTRRKLGPSLYSLHAKGRLPRDLRVLGFARSEMDDGEFRSYLAEAVQEFAPDFDQATWDELAGRLHYVAGDMTESGAYEALGRRLAELDDGAAPRLYYLAVAPRFFEAAVRGLGAAGLADDQEAPRNLVVEKPFGRDLDSARRLNEILYCAFREPQVFRIDHYLGKETAQNLLYLRFANTIFEPVWNRNYVDNVQITVAETVDVGRRAGYYDQAGVLRDMFQNHLLQLFTLVAMEPPAPFNQTTLRDEKVKVLSATRPVAREDVVLGQYEGFLDAEGVAPDSRTPTYAALRLQVDNWRWEGVPFYLRSGKALDAKATTIHIEFKRPPSRLFGAFQSPAPNILSICIQPDEGVHMRFDAKVPDEPSRTAPVDMEFHYGDSFPCVGLPDAYERLLLDALQGDASLFARSDEIENAWRLIDPVVAASEDPASGRPAVYEPGSAGPREAERLPGREGRVWREVCVSHD